ncbi:MAG: response regulator [Gammaproteobacteria bacterium]
MIRITSLPKGSAQTVVRPAPGPKPITLLIIEDDATTRLALACMVADDRFQIVLATSAEDALERLPAIDPDLILCDFMLEGMNGRELCQGLKSSPRWRYVPIIVVTRMDAIAVVTDLLKSGADDVLIKPVRGAELRARVIAALRTRMHYLQLGQADRGYAPPRHAYAQPRLTSEKDAAPQAGAQRSLNVYV